jgi:predicted RNase H-like HicB family nuclease
MKALDYTVFFEPIDKGGYMAIVPALPGIITYGEDLDEARAMVADAIKCHCEGLIQDREELPKDIQTKAEPIKERISILVGYA